MDVDLLIVGAGPVGLYAAYCAGFRGLSTAVVEALPAVGGQIATFYADSLIFDVPGSCEVTGRELIDRLREQAGGFPIELCLGEEVVALEDDGERCGCRQRASARPAPR